MHSKDIEFFENYKRLDKLCGEMFSCRDGVSAYIEYMESEYVRGLRAVPTWGYDFKMLKHVRWVRNKIAHEASRARICEDEDTGFVYDFYDRISSGDDPVTLLEEQPNSARKNRREPRTDDEYGDPPKKKGSGCSGCLVFTAIIAAAVLAGLLYIIFH